MYYNREGRNQESWESGKPGIRKAGNQESQGLGNQGIRKAMNQKGYELGKLRIRKARKQESKGSILISHLEASGLVWHFY